MSAPQSPAEIPSGDTVAKLAAVIDRDPSNPQGYVALGRTVSKMGRFADAETWYRKAIELDASLPAAHNGLGRARQMQGDAGGAIASYQHALQLDAGFGRARVQPRHASGAARAVGKRASRIGARRFAPSRIA